MKRPVRKHPRLKCYDYSQSGSYFVTIQTKPDCPPLSIVEQRQDAIALSLSAYGKTAESQLLGLEVRYPNVKIDHYVIMPTHLHIIITLTHAAGASPRPTLMEAVGAFKSLTTHLCNQRDHLPGRTLFQPSFYEHVIRNEAGYLETCRYIAENPAKWLESGKEPAWNG